ncbi:MAG TPA: PxKF domain-containing protein [Steroidobacteraceae bacterium]|nr:PxKF domain-containing protein [Steroidobacteraceae bacterium]
MKSKIPGLLIVGLLAGPITAQAAVTISTDTATELVGAFSVTGTSVEAATPSVFDTGLSFCAPVRATRSTTATIGLQCAGSPDNPGVSLQVLAGPQSFGSVSGMTSSLAGSAVPTFYFLFSDLQDTGGTDGTFSGTFCFSRSPTGCTLVVPEPEPATLIGFYPPVAQPSVATNLAKAGKTIPLTFYAETASGPIMDLTTVHLTVTGVTCESISTAVSAVEEYVAGQAVSLQNLGGGYYQYNWNTSRADQNSCRTVTLALPDTYSTPTKPIANFKFSRK